MPDRLFAAFVLAVALPVDWTTLSVKVGEHAARAMADTEARQRAVDEYHVPGRA